MPRRPLAKSGGLVPGCPPEWAGVLDATVAGPAPIQLPSQRISHIIPDHGTPHEEDCLHLDVWVPVGGKQQKPTLVFLHGGGFLSGGGSLPCYDGATLAARTGLVVVNMTYRLGVLGFLPIEGIAPANLGLHDQMAALRWIKQAIGSFGGNPDRVTVVGQSAGAYSIAVLAASPTK